MATVEIPEGLAPAAAVDLDAELFVCRGCADQSDRIIFVLDDTHQCANCGEAITAPAGDQPARSSPGR